MYAHACVGAQAACTLHWAPLHTKHRHGPLSSSMSPHSLHTKTRTSINIPIQPFKVRESNSKNPALPCMSNASALHSMRNNYAIIPKTLGAWGMWKVACPACTVTPRHRITIACLQVAYWYWSTCTENSTIISVSTTTSSLSNRFRSHFQVIHTKKLY